MCSFQADVTRFTLAHISDPHLAPPAGSFKPADAISKRLFSRLSWIRARRFEHKPEVLDAIMSDLAAQTPDHVAITGDLTNYAAPAEYRAARAWLQGLGDPARVTVTLGNHDALVAMPVSDGAAQWLEWLGDGLDVVAFPTVRIRGEIALVNVCSSVPTPIGSAAGRVGADQLERLGAELDSLGRQGLFRIVLIHHPVVDGVVSGRKSLKDAAAFRAVLRSAGAELILHGHGHEPVSTQIEGPFGLIPVLGAPSASLAAGAHHAPAHWRRIDIEDRAVTVTERGIGPDGDLTVRELRSYPVAIPAQG